ncbi:MAG TPA: DnaJ domain-containing protein, partial [Archangium sp.]
MKSFQAQTHYEVLEVSVGASAAEIRNAYERLSNLYSDDQVVLYGLIDPARASALRSRLKEAHDCLVDDAKRDAYDVKLGLPPRHVPKPVAAKPSAPKPAVQGSGATAGTGWGSFSWVTPASSPTPAA